MKRQAIGARSSEEVEDADSNENKRIKLIKDSDGSESSEVNCPQTKKADFSPSKSSHSHNHEDQIPIISQNGSSEHISNDSPSKVNNNEQSTHANGDKSAVNSSDQELVTTIRNGPYDGLVVEMTASASGVVSELYYCNFQPDPEEAELLDDAKSMPVLKSYGELNAHNGESTDSFHSEGFEAMKSTNELENKETDSFSSQEKYKSHREELISNSHEKELIDNHDKIKSGANGHDAKSVDNSPDKEYVASCQDIESGAKSDVSNSFDLDNLTLSHLEVTQFEEHTDVIFSVAADDDVILSSSGDTTVKVWSIEEKNLISNFSGHSDSVTSVQLLSQSQSDSLKRKLKQSDVSRIAITGSRDCHIKLWSVYDGHELQSIYTFNGITCLGYLESESYVVVGTDGGKLELWDLCTSKVVQSVRAHEDSVSDIKVLDCNIYSVSVDGTVKIWLFEEEDLYPVYTRKRKERSSGNQDLVPALWKTVAISNNLMYLGDNTNTIKVLDSRAGRLRLFKNQLEDKAICECVTTKNDILLTTFYASSSDAGGVNVWKLPEMTYMCTLSGEVQEICSLAVVHKGNHLRIVTGGHQLLLWDFDFSRSPNKESQSLFHASELECIGHEIAENLVEIRTPESKKSAANPNQNNPNKWCNIM